MAENYISVSLKVIELIAPAVARSSGTNEDRVLAGLNRLWHRCWSLKTDMLTRVQLAGCFGGAELDLLVAGLVEHEMLEQTETGWRVRGAEKYLRIATARSENGRKAAENGNLRRGNQNPNTTQQRPSSPPAVPQQTPNSAPALSPITDHRSPNKEKLLCEPAETEPPTDGPRFFAWAQSIRAESLKVPREKPPKFLRGLTNWFHEAQLELGVDAVGRLQAAWAAFLADPYWRAKGCPWAAWLTKWTALVPPPGPPPAQKCAVCLVESGDCAAVGAVGVGAQGRKVCYPHYGEVAGRLRADGVFDDAPEADGVLDAVIAELERKGAA